MQRTTMKGQRLSLVAAAMALALMGACSKTDDKATVGQRIDQGVATAEQKTERAAEAIDRKAEQAGDAMERAGDKAAHATADASLTAAVKTALITAPELSSLKINVDSAGGVVTLRGQVKTNDEKQRAERVASAVTGVQSVRNDLVVTG